MADKTSKKKPNKKKPQVKTAAEYLAENGVGDNRVAAAILRGARMDGKKPADAARLNKAKKQILGGK